MREMRGYDLFLIHRRHCSCALRFVPNSMSRVLKFFLQNVCCVFHVSIVNCFMAVGLQIPVVYEQECNSSVGFGGS